MASHPARDRSNASPRVSKPSNSTSSIGDDARQAAQLVLQAEFADGRHLRVAPDGGFRRFARNHWQSIDDGHLDQIVLQRLEREGFRYNHRPSGFLKEIRMLLRAQLPTDRESRSNQVPALAINCRNGELRIDVDGGFTLRPHNPASNFDHCLDVDFLPDAVCPIYDQAISQIFSSSKQPRKLIKFWHELAGYLIQPDRRIPLIVIGWGTGANGKTALVTTVRRLLGPEHVAAMPINSLSSSRFAIGNLAGKRMLLDDDVAVGTRLPDGLLKTLSEGKWLTGEKKFRDHVDFDARAIPVLLCNAPPIIADRSDGLRRRLIVIPFEKKLDEQEIDRALFERIHAREMSGVLNRVIAGLQRVIRAGWRFDQPTAVQQATQMWWEQATATFRGYQEGLRRVETTGHTAHLSGRQDKSVVEHSAGAHAEPTRRVDHALPSQSSQIRGERQEAIVNFHISFSGRLDF